MKDSLLNTIKGVLDKDDINLRIKLCAEWYEELAEQDIDEIIRLCNYLNNSQVQTPCVVEGYVIAIIDIAQNLKVKLIDDTNVKKHHNATQDAKKD